MDKEEAQEKYDDAVSSGNTAFLMSQNQDIPDLI